jgi:hypothetical protein
MIPYIIPSHPLPRLIQYTINKYTYIYMELEFLKSLWGLGTEEE